MKKIKLLLTIILAFALFIPTVYADNLLTGSGVWESFFNAWFESAGTITSDNPNSFNIDATSIGTYQWPSSDYGFGAQAKLFNKEISLTKGNFYKYNATITSDKDRKVFIKITDIENNPDTSSSEDIDNVMLEKWITLQANQPYTLDETFMSTANISHISMYYGIGFNGQDSAVANSANQIEVNNISISETDVDITTLPHTTLKKGGTNTKYSSNNVFGITNSEIINRNNKETLKLTLKKDTAIEAKVNNQTVQLQKEGNIVYIPTSYLDTENNDVVIYSKTTYDEKEMILARTSVKNGNLEDYKNNKLNEISQYEKPDNSDAINSLIDKAKTDLENATSLSEMQRIYNEFKDSIKVYINEEEDNNITTVKTPKRKINITNQSTNSANKINDNPLTKDNIIFYFIALIFGVIGLRLVTRKTRKN